MGGSALAGGASSFGFSSLFFTCLTSLILPQSLFGGSGRPDVRDSEAELECDDDGTVAELECEEG